MSNSKYFASLKLDNIYFRDSDEIIKNSICSFGNSLILLDDISEIIFAFGKFDDGKSPIRITIVDDDENRVKNMQNILIDIIYNHVSDFSLERENISNVCPPYIEIPKGFDVMRVTDAFIPPLFRSEDVKDDMLLMSKFLERVNTSSAGYIVLILRPFKKKGKNPFYKWLITNSYFSNRVYESVSENRDVKETIKPYATNEDYLETIESEISNERGHQNKRNIIREFGEVEKRSKNEINYEIHKEIYDISKISALMQMNMDFVYNAITTGAWWISMYIISKPFKEVKRLTSIYASLLSRIGNIYSDLRGSIYGRRTFRYEELKNVSNLLIELYNDTIHDTRRAPDNKILRLKEYDIDLLYFIKEKMYENMDEFYRENLSKYDKILDFLDDIQCPSRYEIPITGNRFASVFQFPFITTPLMKVERGFGYCFKQFSKTDGDDSIEVGNCISSIISSYSTFKDSPARIQINELNKHMLIVGSTGSGKTNSVIKVISSIKEKENNIKVFVLEGAKREYRKYGLKGFKVIDLMNDFIRINIFAHPEFISFESHLSNIGSIINSCLSLPVPLPALMLEALTRAYIMYYKESDSFIKNKNPILFFLFRSVMDVVKKANYAGEIGSNIDAAIKTRLRQLLGGVAGNVLDCSDSWDIMCQNFLSRDLIIELESIGDSRTRSFIMSLFALYFRYAVEADYREKINRNEISKNKISRLLILEEAHRIIGRSSIVREQDNDQTSSEHLEMFSNMLSEIRAFDCGIIISDQSPSKLIPDAVKNTNTKIIMRLVAEDDIRSVIESSGLPEESSKDIPTLLTGQAILITGKQKPSLVKIDEMKMSYKDVKDTISAWSNIEGAEKTFEFIDLMKNIKSFEKDDELKGFIKKNIFPLLKKYGKNCEEKFWNLVSEKINDNNKFKYLKAIDGSEEDIESKKELYGKIDKFNGSPEEFKKVLSNLLEPYDGSLKAQILRMVDMDIIYEKSLEGIKRDVKQGIPTKLFNDEIERGRVILYILASLDEAINSVIKDK